MPTLPPGVFPSFLPSHQRGFGYIMAPDPLQICSCQHPSFLWLCPSDLIMQASHEADVREPLTKTIGNGEHTYANVACMSTHYLLKSVNTHAHTHGLHACKGTRTSRLTYPSSERINVGKAASGHTAATAWMEVRSTAHVQSTWRRGCLNSNSFPLYSRVKQPNRSQWPTYMVV